MNKVALVHIEEPERAKVKQAIQVLRGEIAGPWYRGMLRKLYALKLGHSLKHYIRDGDLTQREYTSWMRFFKLRDFSSLKGMRKRYKEQRKGF